MTWLNWVTSPEFCSCTPANARPYQPQHDFRLPPQQQQQQEQQSLRRAVSSIDYRPPASVTS
eukprot:1144609-Pelagomonas_calceolata.AAC.1